MKPQPQSASAKFDVSRAAEYGIQSRVALAGYDACHELTACVLAATLSTGRAARVLVVGVGGTAQEVITMGTLEASWTFVGVDPSPAMLETAAANLEAHGLLGKTQLLLGTVDDLPVDEPFDAATLIGVLHHVPGDEAKQHLLRSIQSRLKVGAPFVVACNHYTYAEQPLLLKAWAERWRQQGASPDEVKAKQARIMQGAEPPSSEEAVYTLLRECGFGESQRFFSSLFWGGWVTHKCG